MYPEELKYNSEHTWLKMESANRVRVGVTQYAQEQLKEVVFIELPDVGSETLQMEPFGIIESVKATNDLYSPVTGRVVEVNDMLVNDPGMVNRDPYGAAWMIVIELNDPGELNSLLSAAEYRKILGL
ncbi:MAG: glycine cleavage system protein GcvH [Syntrophorhabdaceae bacterium]